MPNVRVIECDEYEPISIGDPVGGVSLSELEHLESVWRLTTGREVTSFFDYGAGFVKPRNWVGSISAGPVSLQVMPRGAKSLQLSAKQLLDRNLGQMLHVSLGSPTLPLGPAQITTAGDRMEKAIEALCDLVLNARRGRVLRRYRTKAEDTRVVRGRIDFGRQIRNNIKKPGLFSSAWVDLDEDCPENRFLKGVLALARRNSGSRIRRRVDEVVTQFDAVADSSAPQEEYPRIRFERLSSEYRQALELAKGILEGNAAGVFCGSLASRGEVMFMPDLWEEFVARLVREIAAPYRRKVWRKSPGRFLGKWESGPRSGSESFEVLPDIEISGAEARPSILLDAKWKWLRTDSRNFGISQEDMYQMTTYSKRLITRNAVLVYPWMGGKAPFEGAVTLKVTTRDFPLAVSVVCVPLLWDGLQDTVDSFRQTVAPVLAA